MSKVLKYKTIVTILHTLGYTEHRQKGSHVIFVHSNGKITVVPKHSNGEVAGGTVHKICKDVGVPFNEFIKNI